jgi:hypothetical protein
MAVLLLLLTALISSHWLYPGHYAYTIEDISDTLLHNGFHQVERFTDHPGTFAWTRGDELTWIDVPNPGGAVIFHIHLAGGPGRTVPLSLQVGQELTTFEVRPEVHTYRILMPPQPDESLRLSFESPVLSLNEYAVREVGIVISRLQTWGDGTIPAQVLWAMLLASMGIYGLLRYTGWHVIMAVNLVLVLQPGVLLLHSHTYHSFLIETLLMTGGIGFIVVTLEIVWQFIPAAPVYHTDCRGYTGLYQAHRLRSVTVGMGLLLLVISANIIHTNLWKEPPSTAYDIYYVWLEGNRLLEGENPYERIKSGNMRSNDKYATYFPGFYILSSGAQLLGWQDFYDWTAFWQPVFLFFNLATGFIIFRLLLGAQKMLLAFAGSAFWLFSRWTLNLNIEYFMDFLPIFFLVLSLALIRRNIWFALLCLGVSLTLKQIGIFLVPIYLLYTWQCYIAEPRMIRYRNFLFALLTLGSIPFITALPFVLWDAEVFVRSILFSATRAPARMDSLEGVIGSYIPQFVGIVAKLPMLLLMICVYLSLWQRKIDIFYASLLVMVIFINFHAVLFPQYFSWLMPLIPLAVLAGDHHKPGVSPFEGETAGS